MTLSFLLCEEETCRLNHVFSTLGAPADLFRIAACGNLDLFAVDDQEALLHVIVNSAVEATMHRVIFEHVGHVVNGKKVVDCYYFDVISFGRGAEYETADTTETVNTNLCHYLILLIIRVKLLCIVSCNFCMNISKRMHFQCAECAFSSASLYSKLSYLSFRLQI